MQWRRFVFVGELMQLVETEAHWTVAQAATFLNFSVSWVYRRVAERAIPHQKIGRSVRFNPKELKRWLAERASVPPREM